MIRSRGSKTAQTLTRYFAHAHARLNHFTDRGMMTFVDVLDADGTSTNMRMRM